MTTVYDVPPGLFIDALAQKLKKDYQTIKPPEWAEYVKTGVSKEQIPTDPDWWYVRGASMLRKIYIKQQVGVQRLRNAYGGKYRRNKRPSRFRKGAGQIIRKLLIQLEQAGLVEKVSKSGRKISSVGRSFLDSTAHSVKKALVKEIPELQKY